MKRFVLGFVLYGLTATILVLSDVHSTFAFVGAGVGTALIAALFVEK